MTKEKIIYKYNELSKKLKETVRTNFNNTVGKEKRTSSQSEDKLEQETLTTLDRIPLVGEVFGISAKNISTFVVVGADRLNRLMYQNKENRGIKDKTDIRVENFGKKLDYDYSLNIEDILEDKYLLVKYLGNGVCEEYYTSKLIRLAFPNIKDEVTRLRQYSSRGPMEFMESFNEVLENPLVYYIDNIDYGYGYVIDDAFKLKFYENTGFENSIMHALDRIENEGKENLIKGRDRLIEEDYPYASIENDIYNLEKRKIKKYQY